ncbi:hypothetical protein AAMO2058_000655000 [Amorphochlora amoebiformis]
MSDISVAATSLLDAGKEMELIVETHAIDGTRLKVRQRGVIGTNATREGKPSPDSLEALRQLKSALRSPKFRLFCRQEFFLGAIDRLYFAQNDFIECLYENGFGNVHKATRTEWSHIRSLLGKPRRMSACFLKEERAKLERYRDDVRCIQQGLTIFCDEFPFPEEVPARLFEGQSVVAVHPITTHLHTGVIVPLTKELRSVIAGPKDMNWSSDQEMPPNLYCVRFDQKSLPPAMVSDTDVMPFGHLHSSLSKLQHPIGPRFPHAAGDAHMVANLLRLLDRKEALLTHLRTMNDQIERIRKPSSPTQSTNTEPHVQTPATTATAKVTAEVTAKVTAEVTAKVTGDVTGDVTADGKEKKQTSSESKTGKVPLAFKQQYAWVIVELEKASRSLDNALQAMRLRQSGISLGEAGSDLSVHVSQLCYQRAREMMQSMREKMAGGSTMSSKISNLIVCCISLILLIQFCAERGLQPLGLDAVLESVRPTHPQNQKLFDRIQTSVRKMKAMLSAV